MVRRWVVVNYLSAEKFLVTKSEYVYDGTKGCFLYNPNSHFQQQEYYNHMAAATDRINYFIHHHIS